MDQISKEVMRMAESSDGTSGIFIQIEGRSMADIKIQVNSHAILTSMKKHKGNQTGAAKELGINRGTVRTYCLDTIAYFADHPEDFNNGTDTNEDSGADELAKSESEPAVNRRWLTDRAQGSPW